MACFPRCRTASISSAGRMWKHTTRYARCSGRNRRSRVDIDTSGATRRRAGVAAIVASAICFGAMAIMARFAYASGVDTTTLLALRFGIAAGILFAVALARGETWPRGKTLATLIGLGALGYGGQAFSFFTALTLAPAGLVALLLYLHPALVALLAAAFLQERLTAPKLAALALALAGTVLTIAPAIASSDSVPRGAGVATGIAFAVM